MVAESEGCPVDVFDRILADFEPMTTVLTEFVRSFDVDYSISLGSDFEVDLDEMKIIYAVALADKSATAFRDNFIARFPACADFDIFTLSLMHELGHLETEYDMIDDSAERATISDNSEYFDLYNERIATDWAGEYLTANHDDMKNWESKVLAIFKKIFDKYED